VLFRSKTDFNAVYAFFKVVKARLGAFLNLLYLLRKPFFKVVKARLGAFLGIVYALSKTVYTDIQLFSDGLIDRLLNYRVYKFFDAHSFTICYIGGKNKAQKR
jgi:hypothetical protein